MLLSLEFCKSVAWVSIYFAHKGGPKLLESAFLYTTEYTCSCVSRLQSMWTAYRELELFIKKLAFSVCLYSAVLSYFSFPLICWMCIQPALFFKGLVMNFLIPLQLISCLALKKFHSWLTMYRIKDIFSRLRLKRIITINRVYLLHKLQPLALTPPLKPVKALSICFQKPDFYR